MIPSTDLNRTFPQTTNFNRAAKSDDCTLITSTLASLFEQNLNKSSKLQQLQLTIATLRTT